MSGVSARYTGMFNTYILYTIAIAIAGIQIILGTVLFTGEIYSQFLD